MKATKLLHNLGQSLWLDNITRDLFNTGTLQRYIEEFNEAGVNVEALAAQLQAEGAKAFVKSWNELLAVIASKSNALKKGELHANSAA
jgi:transaldolase